jgi:tRNA 5-methylaminomethyl-2-thiouridine biosynthesis bifunctional protein
VLRPGAAGDALELCLGGVLRPRDAVDAMCRGAHILLTHPIGRLAQDEGPPGSSVWRAFDAGGACVWSGDLVVLAGGPACDRFAPAAFLPIERRQGQISWAHPGPALPRPITGGAYALADAGALMFGATFDSAGVEADFAALAPSDSDHARNRAALTGLAPALAAALGPAPLAGRVSVRAGLRDRLPAAGVLAPGLGVVTGLGARGLTTGPLAAEAVVSDLLGEPSPLDRGARRAIDPNRFRTAEHPPPARRPPGGDGVTTGAGSAGPGRRPHLRSGWR